MYRRTVIKFTAVAKKRWLDYPQKFGQYPNGKWSLFPCTQEDLNTLENFLLSVARSQASSLIPWPGYFVNDWMGSYLVSQVGTPPPVRELTKTLPRRNVSNGNFSARSRSGEIIVAPWRSDCTIRITAEPRPVTLSSSEYDWDTKDLWKVHSVFPAAQSPIPGEFEGLCYSHAGVIYMGGRLHCETVKVTEEISNDFGSYSIGGHMLDCLDRISEQLPRDEAMIVDCLAQANRGQFDVMSNLAEIPETIIGIVMGIKTILTLYKEASAKEVRLYNQLSVLRKIEQPSAAIRKTIADLSMAISAVWLSFRLAIYPTVSTVEEALNLHLYGISLYQRFRETKVSSIDFGYGDSTCLLDCTERAFIKRGYDTPIAALGWGNLSAVWQIVPLSFVIDRYIAIGNFLTALTSPNLSVIEGATYSWKISAANGSSFDGVPYTVEVHMYERAVINPSSACGITFPQSRTFNQKLDHLALVWALVLDGLVRPSSTRKY